MDEDLQPIYSRLVLVKGYKDTLKLLRKMKSEGKDIDKILKVLVRQRLEKRYPGGRGFSLYCKLREKLIDSEKFTPLCRLKSRGIRSTNKKHCPTHYVHNNVRKPYGGFR